jgi:hypothetical protein
MRDATRRARRYEREQERARVAAQERNRRRKRQVLGGVALALTTLLVATAAFVALRSRSGPGSAAASEVGCSAMEQTAYHVHAHLDIFVDGREVTVPPNIGIELNCIRWLHTHDDSGIIHVEAPERHTYSLGDFFRVWGQPLDSTHLLDRTATGDQKVVAYVNGRRYDGAPETIPIDPHAVITLELGSPLVPPPTFTFPPGV